MGHAHDQDQKDVGGGPVGNQGIVPKVDLIFDQFNTFNADVMFTGFV